MARQSPKPCAKDRCPALVYDGGGWCEKHKPVEGKFADPYRGSRHARGYGNEWSRKRLRILERDNHLCQVCLPQSLISLATQVDHIVPRAAAGTEDDDNLQGICVDCHKAKTALEGRGGRKV